MPKRSLLFTAFCFVLALLFFRGESFRLYGSLFFALYYITQSAWVSIILVSVVQNIFFLPLRFLGELTYPRLKDFEETLAISKQKSEQTFLVKERIIKGDWSVIIYTINFLLLLVAFVSAGRFFLLEIYETPIAEKYLYDWVPRPEIPLQGAIFNFPIFHITSTTFVPWKYIIGLWGVAALFILIPGIIWSLLRTNIFKEKAYLLSFRIKYNHLRVFLVSTIGSLVVLGTYFLRNIPTGIEFGTWSANLARQNTTFNIVTALATALVTIYMGISHAIEAQKHARQAGIDESIINETLRTQIRASVRNAFLLAAFAYWLTHQLPCSHDLSVLSFEGIYVLSSFFVDPFIKKSVSKYQTPSS